MFRHYATTTTRPLIFFFSEDAHTESTRLNAAANDHRNEIARIVRISVALALFVLFFVFRVLSQMCLPLYCVFVMEIWERNGRRWVEQAAALDSARGEVARSATENARLVAALADQRNESGTRPVRCLCAASKQIFG